MLTLAFAGFAAFIFLFAVVPALRAMYYVAKWIIWEKINLPKE